MSYRPITDIWFLARAKLKGGVEYYGAYLGGFPERARALLGATINEPVLHVCGGIFCPRICTAIARINTQIKVISIIALLGLFIHCNKVAVMSKKNFCN